MRPESQLTRRDLLQTLAVSAAIASVPTWARDSTPAARLILGAAEPAPVPIDYLGFSYESAQLADPTFFAEDNHELISLFRLLSEKGVLRIGGNSSEFCWWKAKPEERPPELPASGSC